MDQRTGIAAMPLRCIECKIESGQKARRWRGYRIDDPTADEPPALAFYCPTCAEREFGRLGREPDRERRRFQG
jgi:hypothetical protein